MKAKKLQGCRDGRLEWLIVIPKDTEELSGRQFFSRARERSIRLNKVPLGQREYDFYKRPGNWYLLPQNPSFGVLLFVGARFKTDGREFVRGLVPFYRRCINYSERPLRFFTLWLECAVWSGVMFHDGMVAAIE